jgi:fatty acid-binding protein DegV
VDPHRWSKTRGRLLENDGSMLAGRAGRMHAAIAHGDLDPSGLQKRIASAYSPVELLTCTLTPVAGVHTGPGIMGVNFYLE